MSKAHFRELWEHLKVCHKEDSQVTVMSQEELQSKGGLNRSSKELIYINDLWDLMNQRLDTRTGK